MYNRYIPQADGSYHRRQVPDHPSPVKKSTEEKPLFSDDKSVHPDPPQKKNTAPSQCKRCSVRKQGNHSTDSQASGVTSLLNNLLPKDFDTADLMVILLLLLMSGDCQEDQSTALLTLALYLFL